MVDSGRRQLIAGAASALSLLPLAGLRAQTPVVATRLATIRDGGFNLPAVGASRQDPKEVRAALAAAGLPTDQTQTVLNVTVLRRGPATILIDCGAGANFMQGTGQLMAGLSAAGITPESVTHVLFTHGHPDHLWGVLDDFDTPAFTNASYHFPAAEWDYWFSPGIYASLAEDRHAFAAGAQRILKILDPQVSRFRPGQEPAPGVLAVDSAGHTPGHVAFQTLTDRGQTLIVGDALTHQLLSFRHPDWPGGFDADGDKAVTTRRSLLARAVSERLTIVGYHLPGGGVGRVEAEGAAYRFVQG